MAFVTTFISSETGLPGNVYNIDFSVGPGARGNLPDDIMLVQAMFRIVHFEVSNALAPPPGETSIAVDGKLGPQTIRFILNAQRQAKAAGIPVLLDGIFDPFRSQGQLSTIAKVRYVFELWNNTGHKKCEQDGIDNYSGLPMRDDIPPELVAALRGPQRTVARKYEAQNVGQA
jgi:hypothetical protein